MDEESDEQQNPDVSCLIVRNSIFRELAKASADLKRADNAKDQRRACRDALQTVTKLLRDVDPDKGLHRPFLRLARGFFDLDKGMRPSLFQPSAVIAESGGKPVGTTGPYAKQISAVALVELLAREAGLGVMAARREVAAALAAAGHLTAHKKPMNARTLGLWRANADVGKLQSRLADLKSVAVRTAADLTSATGREDFMRPLVMRLGQPDI